MGWKLGLFAMGFWVCSTAFAVPENCSELVADLKAMKAAQSQLMQSFSKKNETMASVLEQNAKMLEKTMSTRRVIKKSDLKALHVSAKAFRSHQEREESLIEKFDRASSQLLEQVQVCLVQNSSVENLGQSSSASQ